MRPPLDEETLGAAIRAAEGNVLHAVTLCDAFEVDTQARDPQRIPVGFEALLEDMWLQLVDLDDRTTSTQVLDGLGLIAIAAAPLPLTAVARLLEWRHPADVVTFKRYALPFLLEEDAEWHAGESRYRPFHESTREFLTSGDRMSPDVRRKWHDLLARRLAVWPPGEDATDFERDYAARYALLHVSEARNWQRVAQLLADLHHGVAAVEALGPQLFLARLAAIVADKQPAIPEERATVSAPCCGARVSGSSATRAELPNLVHNRLTCVGWSRERIRESFSGFDSGWGLVNAIDIGDEICIFRGHTSIVESCDVDARGRYGVSSGWDGTVRVWNLDRGSDLHHSPRRPPGSRRSRGVCDQRQRPVRGRGLTCAR